jgi:flagellar biosynthesis protein FlhF
MRVKRYIVNALPEAVSMIRSELGKDAVILNTKEIKVGGFMGMFRKKKMEVIAAIESAQPSAAPQLPKAVPPKTEQTLEQMVQSVQRTAAAIMEPPRPVAAPELTPVDKRREEREQFIINEIRDLKQYMATMARQSKEQSFMSGPLLELRDRLDDQELDAKWRDQLIDFLVAKQQEEQTEFTKEQLWEQAFAKLSQWLEPFEGGVIDRQARIVHFVGPTGVGKTTTIAKLAAEQTIKQGRKVGFITSDTYRIAAVDQLRTYANILNVPMEVVFSPMDLPKAFKQLEGRELIYMDTAGRNFRSELHVSEVNSLLHSSEPSETVLVLSLTGKTKDMVAVAAQFRKYGIKKVLFTKLDETSVYGAIFNLIMGFELIPTYVAGGQTVPDDIEPFNGAAYIHLLLGSGSS